MECGNVPSSQVPRRCFCCCWWSSRNRRLRTALEQRSSFAGRTGFCWARALELARFTLLQAIFVQVSPELYFNVLINYFEFLGKQRKEPHKYLGTHHQHMQSYCFSAVAPAWAPLSGASTLTWVFRMEVLEPDCTGWALGFTTTSGGPEGLVPSLRLSLSMKWGSRMYPFHSFCEN